MIVGLEERVVAKTLVAARLVDEAEDLALEGFEMAVRPRYRKRRDEMRAPLCGLVRPALGQHIHDLAHRPRKVARLLRPARGIDARIAAQRVDAQA